jgi:hypothetical protein
MRPKIAILKIFCYRQIPQRPPQDDNLGTGQNDLHYLQLAVKATSRSGRGRVSLMDKMR